MLSVVQLLVAFSFAVVLVIDLALRWKNRIGITELADMRGLVPYPALAVIGGVSSIVCGWLGWALLTTAALAASDGIKVDGGQTTQLERAIVVRSVLLAQCAVFAFCVRATLSRVDIVFRLME